MSKKEWKEPTSEQWTYLHGTLLWSKGTIFQGERLLTTFNKSNELSTMLFERPDRFAIYSKQSRELQDIVRYEEDFFVYSLHRAIFFIFKASHSFAGFKNIYDKVESIIGEGHAKDIRDMRVHIDEYSKGKGDQPDRFVYESPEELYPVKPFAETLFVADASSTIVFPDAYLIGGRINVQNAIMVFEDLLPSIREKCESFMFPLRVN